MANWPYVMRYSVIDQQWLIGSYWSLVEVVPVIVFMQTMQRASQTTVLFTQTIIKIIFQWCVNLFQFITLVQSVHEETGHKCC